MAASTTWLNATLAGTAGGITLLEYGGLSNSSPGTTGAGELSSGGYARQSTTWAAPASAATVTSNSQSWSVAASTTGIGWVTEWTASTSGTYETDIVLSSSVSFGSAGTLGAATGALQVNASQTS
jgi:hypothetical protein